MYAQEIKGFFFFGKAFFIVVPHIKGVHYRWFSKVICGLKNLSLIFFTFWLFLVVNLVIVCVCLC